MSLVKVTAGSAAHRVLRWGTAAVVLVVAVAIPFNSSSVLNGELTLALVYAVAAMGLNLLIGYGGQISLGHGAFFAVGAYAAAAVLAKTDLPWPFALPVAAAAAFVLGLAFGIPALRLRGLYLALMTLALAVAIGPVIKRAEPLTGGVSGLAVPAPAVPGSLESSLDPDQWLYLITLGVAVVMLVLAANLTRGPLGRTLVSVRDAERTATTLGVDAARVKALLFACSAAFAGVGGALFAFALGFVAPESFTLLLSFTFLGAIVVGGLGTVAGSVLGALFVVFVPQYAGDVNQALTGLIYGGTLIAVLYLLPGGAAGLLRRLRRLVVEVVPPTPQGGQDADTHAPGDRPGARGAGADRGVRSGRG